jgi:hypothetical protein
MTKYQTGLIDCIGDEGLDKATTIAAECSVLDATGEDIIFVDLGSPDEVLSALVQADVIEVSDMKLLINNNIMQLCLVA